METRSTAQAKGRGRCQDLRHHLSRGFERLHSRRLDSHQNFSSSTSSQHLRAAQSEPFNNWNDSLVASREDVRCRRNNRFRRWIRSLLVRLSLPRSCSCLTLASRSGRWDTPAHPLIDDDASPEFPTIFPGKDYANSRVLDFKELDKPFEDLFARDKVPRQPWHDVGLQIIGQPARDLSRHYIQRFVTPKPSSSSPRPLLITRADGTCCCEPRITPSKCHSSSLLPTSRPLSFKHYESLVLAKYRSVDRLDLGRWELDTSRIRFKPLTSKRSLCRSILCTSVSLPLLFR